MARKKGGARFAISMSLDQELYDKIVRLAYEDDRTLASYIRLVLKRHFKEHPVGTPAVRSSDLPPIS